MLNQPAAAAARILVAGRNFGCGSSREHAPWALLDYGFRAVISTEIADIFSSNALKNGLLPIVVDEAHAAWLLAHPGAELQIDLEHNTVRLPDGDAVGFAIERFARYCLLNGVDELGYLRSQEPAIARFERDARMKATHRGDRRRWRRARSHGRGGARAAGRGGCASGTNSRCTRRPSAARPSISAAIRCRRPRWTLCRAADAVLLGAIGGPKWSAPQAPVRPEQGLLRLRKALGVYANLRPVAVHPALREASTLKSEVLEGVDLMFVRELTGGIYFGAKTRSAEAASDLCSYTVAEIERIVRVAARLARSRRGKLTSIDKANVLETSRLWREVTERIVSA